MRGVGSVPSIAALGGLLTLLLVRGCAGAPPAPRRAPITPPALAARDVMFRLHTGQPSLIVVSTVLGQQKAALPLSLVVDGVPRPLGIEKADVRFDGNAVTA